MSAKRFPLGLVAVPLIGLTSLARNLPATGQLIPDNSLGRESSVVTPNVNLDRNPATLIQGGASRGNNLFHSFQEFNIEDGERVYFARPSQIENILTRVTGVNRSRILGTLGVTGPANLFLINPNGIIFGPQARLDINGSFFASTASGLLLGNGFDFSADNPQIPPLLSINIPIGLRFRDYPGDIISNSRGQVFGNLTTSEGLQVPNGKNLALVGGNVQLQSGSLNYPGLAGLLSAPGGRIELGGLRAAGTVLLTSEGHLLFPEGVERGNISIENYVVSVISNGEGAIAIQGKNFNLAGSILSAGILPGMQAQGNQIGDIAIEATGDGVLIGSQVRNNVQPVALGNGGDIEIVAHSLAFIPTTVVATTTFGLGDAGNIRIQATDAVSFKGNNNNTFNGAFSAVGSGAIGRGGNVEITARTLSVTNGAQLDSSSLGMGDAGKVKITADAVSLDGGNIFSGLALGAMGRGGDIEIAARTLSVIYGAQLSTETKGFGNAGSIRIQADTASFDGVDSNGNLSRATTSVGATGIGQGGNVIVEAHSLSMRNGAQLNANTFGIGDAGNVKVKVDTASLDGVGSKGRSSGPGSIVGPTGIGKGGNVNVEAHSLSVRNGAQLNASTFGIGDAGNITVKADTVFLDGVGSNEFPSGPASIVGATGIGKGGNVTVEVRSLSVTNGAVVNTRTFGTGDAGNITVKAGTVFLDGVGSNGFSSGLTSSVVTNGKGQGGNVTVEAHSLSVTNGAQLNASTLGIGNAGSVKIQVDTASFDGVGSNGRSSGPISIIEPTGKGQGGDVDVEAHSLFVTNGAQLNTSTFGIGDGGNVRVKADTVVLDGVSSDRFSSGLGSIVGPSGIGKGGNVTVEARSLSVTNGAQLNASTLGIGNAGSVKIQVDTASFDGVGSNGRSSGPISIIEPTGKGQGGDVDVEAHSLSMRNGAQLNTSTFGIGDGGDVRVKADTVVLDGVDSDGSPSGPASIVGPSGIGKGGNVTVEVRSLSVTNGAVVNTRTFGTGDAGNITVKAGTVFLDGVGSNRFSSGLTSSVGTNGKGQGGNVTVQARSLSMRNGAQLNASTLGIGNAGSVKIQVDTAFFDGVGSNGRSSGPISIIEPTGKGQGGDVDVEAHSLFVTNGAQLNTSTFGIGDGGNVRVKADTVFFDGVGSNGDPSALGSQVGASGKGQGGNVEVDVRSLSVTNGALLSASTFGIGNAGDITIQATDTVSWSRGNALSEVGQNANGRGGNVEVTARNVSLVQGSQLSASSLGLGNAGDIIINANSVVLDDSAVVSDSLADNRVRAGNIAFDTKARSLPDSLIFADNLGDGSAGSIQLNANLINLKNSRISALTYGEQGNINIRSEQLILRDNSNISTDARVTAQGGNINIETGTLTALENSDIRANAQDGLGGRVSITAQGIFGTRFRRKETPQSDITATSQLGPAFSGTVELNTQVDPTQNLVALPQTIVAPNQLIAQNPCQLGRESRFTITGKGGLPPTPSESLSSNEARVSLVEPTSPTPLSTVPQPLENSPVNPPSSLANLTPARGWIRNAQGEVILVSYNPNPDESVRSRSNSLRSGGPLQSPSCQPPLVQP